MIEIRLHRGVAGPGVYLSAGQGELRNPSAGRQEKSTVFGRVHVVGWIEYFGHQLPALCRHFFRNTNNFNTPRAVACRLEADFAHDNPR